MKITQFKEGDIITRVKRTEYNGDGSYCGDRLEFVGFEKDIIFCLHDFCGEPNLIKLTGSHGWNDNGWDSYPMKLHQKAIKRLKELAKKYIKNEK